MISAKERLPLDDDSFVVMIVTDPRRFDELLHELEECFDIGSLFSSSDESPEAKEAYKSIYTCESRCTDKPS